jgi:hypothetical protein
MTTPGTTERERRAAAAAERLGEDIVPVDVYLPWGPDTSDIDPAIRESTPEELRGEA